MTKAAEATKRWREKNPGYASKKSTEWSKTPQGKAYAKNYRDTMKDHPERLASYRASYKRSYDKSNKDQLLSYLGLTQKDKQEIIDLQDNKCAVCRREFGEKLRPNCDHNHKTGKIRGVLCVTCNTGLGHFRESIETLKEAIAYLKQYED